MAVHPQDLVDEVDKRSREQFCQKPSEEKRKRFFDEMEKHMKYHHCELPEIDPKRLRKYVLNKIDGAIGADGWHARELQLLPEKAWENLAEMCAKVEEFGEWPRAL
eukprot:3039406-Heterocapsa_arctica.AAC.1